MYCMYLSLKALRHKILKIPFNKSLSFSNEILQKYFLAEDNLIFYLHENCSHSTLERQSSLFYDGIRKFETDFWG